MQGMRIKGFQLGDGTVAVVSCMYYHLVYVGLKTFLHSPQSIQPQMQWGLLRAKSQVLVLVSLHQQVLTAKP